jgi:uncharacterized protein (TIGR00251 family)
MSGWPIVESDGGVTFAVRVIPRSSRDEIVGAQGDALKIKLTAPPVEGAANTALIEFLAKALGVRRGAVSIVRGAGSRNKLVRVQGVTPARVRQLLRVSD